MGHLWLAEKIFELLHYIPTDPRQVPFKMAGLLPNSVANTRVMKWLALLDSLDQSTLYIIHASHAKVPDSNPVYRTLIFNHTFIVDRLVFSRAPFFSRLAIFFKSRSVIFAGSYLQYVRNIAACIVSVRNGRLISPSSHNNRHCNCQRGTCSLSLQMCSSYVRFSLILYIVHLLLCCGLVSLCFYF